MRSRARAAELRKMLEPLLLQASAGAMFVCWLGVIKQRLKGVKHVLNYAPLDYADLDFFASFLLWHTCRAGLVL